MPHAVLISLLLMYNHSETLIETNRKAPNIISSIPPLLYRFSVQTFISILSVSSVFILL